RVRTDEVDGAGDPAVVAPRHDQEHVAGHALSDQREEGTVEVGPTPFARAGLHVEGKEGVPGVFGDIAAAERMDRDAVGEGIAPFTLDRLAMARIQRGEESVKMAITLVAPVELLV